jgi:hypothetical protein
MKATIMHSLNDNELAALHAKFIVPVAMSRMLNNLEPLDDVAEYMLHDMIGGHQPDTALLCIALCAQNLAAHAAHLPIGRILTIEANRIVEEYGPLWIRHAKNGLAIDDRKLGNALSHVPEDLESIGDLLLATCGELGEDRRAAATLAEILGSEAHMHMEEAEALLEEMFIPDTAADLGNVVMFPGVRPR